MSQEEKNELVDLAVTKALELLPAHEAKEFLQGLPVCFAKVVDNLVIEALEPRLVTVTLGAGRRA